MMSNCRSCDAEIVWGRLNDKPHPMDPPIKALRPTGLVRDGAPVVKFEDVHISHFATCPDAGKWRR